MARTYESYSHCPKQLTCSLSHACVHQLANRGKSNDGLVS